MQKALLTTSASFLLAVLGINFLLSESPAPAAPSKAGPGMVRAAQVVLDSLGDAQRKAASFDLKDAERFNWQFVPLERKGVPLKDLSEEQRGKVRDLLRASLSEAGFKKAEEVRGLEDVLRGIEGPSRKFARDPLIYHVFFFGKPSKTDAWAWRFEGHHLSLSFALKGETLVSSTPAFFGANPAIIREGDRKGERILAGTEDIARELATSLSEEQLKEAKDLPDTKQDPVEVPGAGTAAYTGPFPRGIPAEKLTEAQRKTLVKLVHEYTQRITPEAAAPIQKEDGTIPDLEKLHFVWRGGIKPYEGHSYMVHGSKFMINYINAQNDAAHVHSCLRILETEFPGK